MDDGKAGDSPEAFPGFADGLGSDFLGDELVIRKLSKFGSPTDSAESFLADPFPVGVDEYPSAGIVESVVKALFQLVGGY